MTTGQAMRRCTRCARDLPATRDHFYAYGYLSGATLRAVCKPCYIQQQEERRARNRALRAQKKSQSI